jgi:hypothetical protein
MPPLMPLALQKRMKLSDHLTPHLTPLTAAELREAKHGCGMLSQTPVLDVCSADGAVDAISAIANMHAVHAAAQQIVGPDLHVTGGPFADSLMLTFA